MCSSESKALISEGTEDSQRNYPENLSAACTQAVQSLGRSLTLPTNGEMLWYITLLRVYEYVVIIMCLCNLYVLQFNS